MPEPSGDNPFLNQDELAICRRRGHSAGLMVPDKWSRCKWCGVWLRERTIIEEREDEPPEHERSGLSKYQ